MFLYDRTNETVSNDVYHDENRVYRCYGNARWLKHDGMLLMMLHSRQAF